MQRDCRLGDRAPGFSHQGLVGPTAGGRGSGHPGHRAHSEGALAPRSALLKNEQGEYLSSGGLARAAVTAGGQLGLGAAPWPCQSPRLLREGASRGVSQVGADGPGSSSRNSLSKNHAWKHKCRIAHSRARSHNALTHAHTHPAGAQSRVGAEFSTDSRGTNRTHPQAYRSSESNRTHTRAHERQPPRTRLPPGPDLPPAPFPIPPFPILVAGMDLSRAGKIACAGVAAACSLRPAHSRTAHLAAATSAARATAQV